MSNQNLISGWLFLVALSTATTLVTISAPVDTRERAIMSALVLIFAGLKARIILTRYLGLSRSRFWMTGFDATIGLFLALAYAIYVFSNNS
ncbi:MAG: hypothetical protein ABL931_22350 [Usitatibacteraceae bacterium]